MNLSNYLKAGYPGIYVLTNEPLRAISSIRIDGFTICTWDCIRGIIYRETNKLIEDAIDPLSALKWLTKKSDTILFAQNLYHFISSVEIIQEIQNDIPIWKASGCCLVISGFSIALPQEISTFFTIIDFKLPTRQEISIIQEELGNSVGVEVSEEAVDAALGLTEFESETAFAYSLVLKHKFCPEVVTAQKMQMIKRTGLMEFFPPVEVNQVGGLILLKQYLVNRKKAFDPSYSHLPKPKALLLVGIPGTGKSLSCKAAASILNWPLIRLDISSLKGSLVGESERQMRQATSTIDAFGKAIVWLDEVEKVFSGVKSSGRTDGGTTASMFGHFLTWMQETTSPVIIMATANNIHELPPEFLRAGRFDAMFFVDVPSLMERTEIIRIMNNRYNSEIPEKLSEELSGWTGAEIEQLAKDSLFDGLAEARKNIVPLSKTMKEEISNLQKWAQTRARKANSPDETDNPKTMRRIM